MKHVFFMRSESLVHLATFWIERPVCNTQDIVVSRDSAKLVISYQYLDITNDPGELCYNEIIPTLLKF